MAPPPDTDDTQALTAIAVHLARLDERSELRTEQLARIEGGVDKINGRLRLVEQEQASIRGRMKLLSALGALITGAFGSIIAAIKSST